MLYFSEGTFGDASDWNASEITLIDSVFSEHLSEPEIWTNQLYETFPTSSNIHPNVMNNYNLDNCFLSFEELMGSLSSTADNGVSTCRLTDGGIDTVSNNKKQ